jgi:exodeoxyribonuclease VII small subunit
VARLDEILERIERGEVDIDELSALVEEAAGLVSLCRRKLTQAEMQVKRITERLEREAEEVPPEAPPEEGLGEEEVPF